LGLAGNRDEARRTLLAMRQPSRISTFQTWIEYLLMWLDRRADEMIAHLSRLTTLKIQDDPEAIFQEGWLFCDVGEYDTGLTYLRRAVDRGYFVVSTLSESKQFDALRGRADFEAILADAEAGRRRALASFRDAGGDRLLGLRA
jgi:hypothetical protein